MSEVYIRSQNKEKLYRLGGNYACVEYGEYEDIKKKRGGAEADKKRHVICISDGCLEEIGEYATKERCLEVLDEIQKACVNACRTMPNFALMLLAALPDWITQIQTHGAPPAAELTRYLMNKYGVPASHVIRHYDVTGKICPNPYVYNTSAHTWDEFKRKISGQAETPQGGNEKTIWNFLTGKGLNAYAVAGIMGNLYAESGLMPNNLQNAYNNKLGKTDAEYTAAVDNGSYGNFVKDSAGYGLAQWTYWSRKQALFNHAKQAGVSIADLNMQLGFLWEELQGYTAVMDALKKAGSVRAASDAVLTGYEKPADQSETVKKKRAEYGEGYYKKYAAGNGTKYYRVRKSWTDAASQLGAFTSLENAKSACKAGYTVYDDNGKAVYTAAGQQASAGVPFSVQVDILDLNIRTGAGTNYAKTGETTGKGVFTIVEVKAGQGASVGWGRLKSGAGWISLDYATRLA